MTNLKEQLANFDQQVSFHLAKNEYSQLAEYLSEVLTTADDICLNRKYSIRNILISNLAIFKQVFLAINQKREPFFDVKTIKKALSSDVHQQLTEIFNKHFSNPSVQFTRIDGRKRIFVEEADLHNLERDIFSKIAEKVYLNENPITLEKVLFEKIYPIDIPDIKTSFWHIDSLQDQLKMVLPISHIRQSNAPMRYLGKVNHLSDYSEQKWQKIHTIYKISGLAVSKANYFEDSLVDPKNVLSSEAGMGDVILFNPQVIHTGSICEQGSRDSITLYFNVDTLRNRCLRKIH